MIAGTRQQHRIATLVVLAGLVAGCWINLLRLTRRHAVDLLFNDTWVYYALLFVNKGFLNAFLRQHGPVHMGIGLVFDGLVMNATRRNVAALALAVTLTLLAAALAHLGLTENMLVWPLSSSSFFPLLFLGLIDLSLASRNELVRWAGVSALIPFSVYTGFGCLSGWQYFSFSSQRESRTAGLRYALSHWQSLF